jgi:hypothetical protein
MVRKRKRRSLSKLRKQLKKYYTVVVPWVKEGRTKWHSGESDRGGPFHTLSRGAFNTRKEAEEWAKKNLGGARFAIKSYPKL